jgi:2-polyprenyl-3-methyl-5-hydroxy-6-metoxy-1,4-benzoquinol methylase
MKIRQQIQEDEYNYPYHYIGRRIGGFSHFVIDEWAINYVSTIEFLIKKIKQLSPKVVIDLGCGDGRFTGELHRELIGSKIIGLDYSEKAINLAKVMNQNCTFVKNNILKDRVSLKADVIVLMEVIEHIPIKDLGKFISKAHDLLKPGGHIIVTVPHKNKKLEIKHFQHFDSKSISKYFDGLFHTKETFYIERNNILSRMVSAILNNRYVIVRYNHFLQFIYLVWKKMVFIAPKENNCERMIIILNKKSKNK